MVSCNFFSCGAYKAGGVYHACITSLLKKKTTILSTLWDFHVIHLRRKYVYLSVFFISSFASLWTDDVAFAGKKIFETKMVHDFNTFTRIEESPGCKH